VYSKIVFEVEVEVLALYSDTDREISDQYRFTSWQAPGKNDAWTSAHCGLWRVSSLAPTPAASLATRRACSHTENVYPQPKLVSIHRPWGINGLVGRGTCELPKELRVDLYGRCYELAFVAGPRFEPGSPCLESCALTTRSTRLIFIVPMREATPSQPISTIFGTSGNLTDIMNHSKFILIGWGVSVRPVRESCLFP
jgi:hypothetical protein